MKNTTLKQLIDEIRGNSERIDHEIVKDHMIKLSNILERDYLPIEKKMIIDVCLDIGFSNHLKKDFHGTFEISEYFAEMKRRSEIYYNENFNQK